MIKRCKVKVSKLIPIFCELPTLQAECLCAAHSKIYTEIRSALKFKDKPKSPLFARHSADMLLALKRIADGEENPRETARETLALMEHK